MKKSSIKEIIKNEAALIKATLKTSDYTGATFQAQQSSQATIINKLIEIENAAHDPSISIYQLKYLISSFKGWRYLIKINKQKITDALCWDVIKLIENQ